MSRGGGGRWTVSPVAAAAVPIGIGLVGNLATSTVEMKTWWWAPATWAVTGLLVVAAAVMQLGQSRPDRAERDSADRPDRGPAAISNLPARNPYFTGRAAVLEQMHHQLRSAGRNGDSVIAAVSVRGIGGVGKTQLALEYAHRHAGEYALVWWVNAETPALATTDLVALAEQLGIAVTARPTAMLAGLWTALAARDDWLLIYDNVEDVAALGRLRPRSGGRLLVTGRTPALSRLSPVIEVTELTREESLDLLKARAPSLTSGALDRVAHALGDLPLALEQAGCFLAETGLNVTGFLDLLASQPAMAGLDEPTLDRHPGLAAMVTASRARLQDIAPKTGELADQLSFLAPEWLPLASSPDEYGVRLADTATTLQHMRLLTRLGLARDGGDSVLMHRLVQALLRGSLPGTERATALNGAQRLIATARLGDSRDTAMWPTRALLTPHLQTLSEHLTRPDSSLVAENERFRHLVINHLDYLGTSGQHDPAARTLAEQSRCRWNSTIGPDQPDTLHAAHALATALYWTGDFERARELGQDTLDRRQRVLGEDHPDTIRTANNLAFTLMKLGQKQQARSLCRRTLAHTPALGDDHPSILGAAFALAAANNRLGAYAEARDLNQDVLERRRRLYSEDHPDTLRSACNLAHDLFQLGAYEQALHLQQDTWQRQHRTLGDDHPDTQRSADDLHTTQRALAGNLRPN